MIRAFLGLDLPPALRGALQVQPRGVEAVLRLLDARDGFNYRARVIDPQKDIA